MYSDRPFGRTSFVTIIAHDWVVQFCANLQMRSRSWFFSTVFRVYSEISVRKGNSVLALLLRLRPPHRIDGRKHTVRFFKVTLIEMSHQIRARGMIGNGQDNIWSEYEQLPMDRFWEKFKKPLKLHFLALSADQFWRLRLHIASPSILDDLNYLKKVVGVLKGCKL